MGKRDSHFFLPYFVMQMAAGDFFFLGFLAMVVIKKEKRGNQPLGLVALDLHMPKAGLCGNCYIWLAANKKKNWPLFGLKSNTKMRITPKST